MKIMLTTFTIFLIFCLQVALTVVINDNNESHENHSSFKYDHQVCQKYLPGMLKESLAKWPKITASDIEKATSAAGLRVRYIRGEWFVSNESKWVVHTRTPAMKLIFHSLSEQFPPSLKETNLDFYMDTSDGEKSKGPVVSYCAKINSSSIMVPDYAFLAWPESGQEASYNTVYRRLVEIAEENTPQSKKDKGKMLFAGYLGPRRQRLTKGFDPQFLEVRDHRFSAMSTKNTVPQKFHSYLSIYDLCQNQYLLHLPGGITHSSRIRFLLLCQSTVIWLDEWFDKSTSDAYDNGKKNTSQHNFHNHAKNIEPLYSEWYYSALEPWEHYIPIRNGQELNNLMKQLQTDKVLQQKAEKIAMKGRQLAMHLLHPDCIRSFWLAFFEEYSKRLDFVVSSTPPSYAKHMIFSSLLDLRAMDVMRSQKLKEQPSILDNGILSILPSF